MGEVVGADELVSGAWATGWANKSPDCVCSCCSASLSHVRKLRRLNSTASCAQSGAWRWRLCKPLGNAVCRLTSVLMVTNLYDKGKKDKAACRFSPTLPLISWAWFITFCKVSYCANHFTAVLGPHLSTPGTLSTLSPIKAR